MRDERPVMIWMTTGFPPEISGTASGHDDRARWFARHGSFRVVVLAPAWDGVESTPATDDYPEVIRYPAKPWPPFRDFRVPTLSAARVIESTVRRLRPALILHADLERAFMFATWRLPGRRWARRHGVPYLAFYHTDFYNFARTYPVWRHLRDIVIRPIMRLLYSSVDAAICPSPVAAAQADSFRVPRAYALRFDGVDTHYFRPERRDRRFVPALVTRLTADDSVGEGRVILSLGRLAWEKRVDLIIEAFGRLQRRTDLADVRLVVAGSGAGDIEDRLHQVAQRIPHPERVHFVGAVRGDDKAILLASADVLCLASPYETFGVTVTEAMASGLVVVAPAGGAVTDYLSHRRNSYLYRPLDLDSLTDSLEEAVTADRAPVARQALADVQQFSMDSVAADLDRFFGGIATTKQFPDSRLEFEALPS